MDKKLKFDVPATLAAPKDEEAPDVQEVEVVEPPEPLMAPRPIVINPGPYRPSDEELRPLPTINPGPPRWEEAPLPPPAINPGPYEPQPRLDPAPSAPYEDESSEEE